MFPIISFQSCMDVILCNYNLHGLTDILKIVVKLSFVGILPSDISITPNTRGSLFQSVLKLGQNSII